jgi:hypothetical protein
MVPVEGQRGGLMATARLSCGHALSDSSKTPNVPPIPKAVTRSLSIEVNQVR